MHALRPFREHPVDVPSDHVPDGHRKLKCVDQLLDDCKRIAGLELNDGVHVRVDVVQKPGRNGQTCVPQHVGAAQDSMQEDPARTAVSVDERVNRLELRVHDSSFRDRGHIAAVHESNQIIKAAEHAVGARRHEQRAVRAIRGAANPNLLVTQAAAERQTRVLPILSAACDQGFVHLADALNRKLSRKAKRGAHGCNVSSDDAGVLRHIARQLGQGNVAHTRRHVLNLRARRRLAAQQQSWQIVAAGFLLRIEANKQEGNFLHAALQFGGDEDALVTQLKRNRRAIRSSDFPTTRLRHALQRIGVNPPRKLLVTHGLPLIAQLAVAAHAPLRFASMMVLNRETDVVSFLLWLV